MASHPAPCLPQQDSPADCFYRAASILRDYKIGKLPQAIASVIALAATPEGDRYLARAVRGLELCEPAHWRYAVPDPIQPQIPPQEPS